MTASNRWLPSVPMAAVAMAVIMATAAGLAAGCGATPDVDTVTIDSDVPPTAALAPDSEPEVGAIDDPDSDLGDLPPGPGSAPLSARANAVGVWTGSEVLVIGGDPEAWCPLGADCVAPDFESLSDGAAFDPEAGTWRSIADAPAPITRFAAVAAVPDPDVTAGEPDGSGAGFVYVLTRPLFTDTGRTEPAFVRYDLAADSWTTLPLPPDVGEIWPAITTVGGGLLAYPGTDEVGEQPDRLFDPVSGSWTDLPDDPLSPSFDRFYAPVDDGLLLFAKDIEPNPGSDGPSLARIARFDQDTATWTELGRSDVLWTESGLTLGDRVLFPHGGFSDGGQVDGWGRRVPHGGVYNVATNTWETFPARVVEEQIAIGGVVAGDRSDVWSTDGVILDLESGSLLRLRSSSEPDPVQGRTVVGAASQVVVFGGEEWDDDGGRVTDEFHLVDLP